MSKPNQPKLERIRNYSTVLAHIIKDDRISGNRRLLAALLGKYLSIGENKKNGKPEPVSEQETKDKELLYNILVSEFGSHKHIRWYDTEDESVDAATKLELDTSLKIRSVFDEVIPRGKDVQG